jgi:hypothetical protein
MSSGQQPNAIQKPIQQDWANREYIEVITCSIKKIADFLNSFGKILKDSVGDIVIYHAKISKFILKMSMFPLSA